MIPSARGGAHGVLHVIAPSPAGGAESVVLALASAATDRTRAVILNQVDSPSTPAHPLVIELRRARVATEEIRCGRRQYRAEIRTLQKRLRNSPPAVIHTHGYHATWVGYHAGRALDIALVSTVHGYLRRSLKERFYNFVDRRLLRRFDAVIAVSQGIQDQLIDSGIEASRVHLVQNGLATRTFMSRGDARRELRLGEEESVIGWIGRLSPEKGPDLLIEALTRVEDAVAVVIGDGPLAAQLRALAQVAGLGSSRLKFIGLRPNASELLPAFDALALTSRTEGTPMVLLEAVSARVPIVSFAVGGIPNLLTPSTAWLVPPADIDAFALALRTALADRETARARAELAATNLTERLSAERWLERVWSVYALAVARHSSRRGHDASDT